MCRIHETSGACPFTASLKFCLAGIVLLCSFHAPRAAAQPATFHDGVLSIPYLGFGSQYFSAELALIPDSEPLQFELIAAFEVAIRENSTAGHYADGVLFIPDVNYQGTTLWVELEWVGATRFQLADYGPNRSTTAQPGLTGQPTWIRFDGNASDVGIGADGSVWVVGKDERPGGFGIYFRDGNSWQRVDGAALRIDVGPDGEPWIINDRDEIYRRQDGSWIQMQGNARDVGIGADGSVWVAAGSGIFRWLGGQEWEPGGGSGVRIDVDPRGNPWVLGYTDDIYQLVDKRWLRRPGAARDIGIGADGSVWIIGTGSGAGGYDIFRWNGAGWNRVTGSGIEVSVDQYGYPWVLASGGEIYRAE